MNEDTGEDLDVEEVAFDEDTESNVVPPTSNPASEGSFQTWWMNVTFEVGPDDAVKTKP